MSVIVSGDSSTLSSNPVIYFELENGLPIISNYFDRFKQKDATIRVEDMSEGKIEKVVISGKKYKVNKVINMPPSMIRVTIYEKK